MKVHNSKRLRTYQRKKGKKSTFSVHLQNHKAEYQECQELIGEKSSRRQHLRVEYNSVKSGSREQFCRNLPWIRCPHKLSYDNNIQRTFKNSPTRRPTKNCNKCTTLVTPLDNTGVCAWVGAESRWGTLCTFHVILFAWISKLSGKSKFSSLFLKNKQAGGLKQVVMTSGYLVGILKTFWS